MEIGLSAAQATAFTTAVTGAAAALTAQNTARDAAKAATLTAAGAFENLRAKAAETVQLIRLYAEAQADPNLVYSTAQIPAPATPTPVPPPAKPTDHSVTLDTATGAPVLRWKASNPVGGGGTTYLVRRRLPTQTAFVFVGTGGGAGGPTKEFKDSTFVAGPDSVQYTVQGQRSDSTGPVSDIFTVTFGVSGGDGISVESAPAPASMKMAA
jgi:hypothetical protein